MSTTLQYASRIPRQQALRRWTRAATVTLAVAGAVAAVAFAAGGLRAYLETFGGCATGRDSARFTIRFLSGGLCLLPLAGWAAAGQSGHGIGVCRAASWAALTAWISAVVISSAWP